MSQYNSIWLHVAHYHNVAELLQNFQMYHCIYIYQVLQHTNSVSNVRCELISVNCSYTEYNSSICHNKKRFEHSRNMCPCYTTIVNLWQLIQLSTSYWTIHNITLHVSHYTTCTNTWMYLVHTYMHDHILPHNNYQITTIINHHS